MEIFSKIIFLDASVLEKDNFFRGYKIKRLAELAGKGEISLKLTYITYNELLGRFRKNIAKAKKTIKNVVDELHTESKVLKNLEHFDFLYAIEKFDAEKHRESLKFQLDELIKNSKIEIVPMSISNSEEVFDAYFEQKPPFGLEQKKDQFPDAFILNLIKNWCELNDSKAIILSSDKDMTSMNDDENVKPMSDIAGLIDSINRQLFKRDRLEFIDFSTDEIFNSLVASIDLNYQDDFGHELYQKLLWNENLEELEYDNALVSDIELIDNDILDISDISISVQTKIKCTISIDLDYLDYTNGIYDKEDGIWFNIERVNQTRIYEIYLDIISETEYNFEKVDSEDNYIEFDQIVDYSIVDFDEDSLIEIEKAENIA